jgi:superfamily II DNA/RNA helicase
MNPLSLFHPAVAVWFERTFAAPTAAQVQAWSAIQAGRHVLIAAPTGSGKTLAAFLAAIRTAGTIDEMLPISKNRLVITRIGLLSYALDFSMEDENEAAVRSGASSSMAKT